MIEQATTMQALLDELFHGMRDGVIVSDRSAKILFMNRAAEKLLSIEAKKAVGTSLCELVCGHLAFPGCAECKGRCALPQSAPPGSREFLGSRDQSRFLWRFFEVTRLPFFQNLRVRCLKIDTPLFGESDREKYFTLIEDATLDARLARLQEEWREMVAHDLRSPLAGVYAALRMLEDRRPEEAVEPSQSLLISAGVRSCRKLLEVVNLYMDILQLESGMMPVRREPVPLGPVVARSVERASALARSRNVRVLVDSAQAPVVTGDAELIGHVLDNILDNALKFTPSGGQVDVTARRDGPRPALSIKDTGPGMDEQTVSHLFDRLYQARARREGRIKGNGLGLAYCKEAMAAMHGEVGLVSRPGAGSDFILRFACAEPGAPGR